MTRHFIQKQLSKTILNLITVLFVFGYFGICECRKLTLEDKEPIIKKESVIGMRKSLRVERGIYQVLDKTVASNDSSDIYSPQNWSFVQTINDTTTKSVTLSAEKYDKIRNSFGMEDNILNGQKDDLLKKPRETRNVFENVHNDNLCYLCDTCDDTGTCSVDGLNISSRYTATSQLNNSLCKESGIDKANIFIRKDQLSQDVVEYVFPFIYLIPPNDAGCYVKLYHNGNMLEDTIYIPMEGQIISHSDKWKIEKKNQAFNLIQFSIKKYTDKEKTTDIKTGQYSLHFAQNKSVRVYYYNQKTIVFNAFDQNKNGIQKSNYSSISIPLKFPAFQDCIDHRLSIDYTSVNQSQKIKNLVGCHFVETNQRNLESLSLHNVTLTENQTKQCIVSWMDNDNQEHGGVFNVTINQIQQPIVITHGTSGSIPTVVKPLYTDIMLALTCDACFVRPCRGKNKNSRVTFAIPFILTNKTYIIKQAHPHNVPDLSIIILAVTISFLLFISFIVIIYQFLKRMRDKRYLYTLREFPSSFPSNQVAEVGDYHCLVEGCHNRICSHAITEVMKYLPDWVEPHMVYSESAIEKKEILGHGQYGSVHQGLFHNGNAVWKIAIKTTRTKNLGNQYDRNVEGHSQNRYKSDDEISSLMEEAKTMWKVGSYHENIVNLQGITVKVEEETIHQVSLILEYCALGNLKSYLIDHYKEFNENIKTTKKEADIADVSEPNKHTIDLLMLWSYQVASGMEFLGSRNIYHGDLAARNVLLTDQLVAKVSDFGLSKRLYQSIHSGYGENGMRLPIKWLALEVLMHGNATIKSDVWSYGILLWEIFELGSEPYRRGIDYQTLRDELLAGSRLPSPTFSIPKISHLIQTCWLADPIERPTFTKIKDKLFQSCPVLSRESENDTSYYLSVCAYNRMRDQYKLIQESNPMFNSPKNDEQDDECVTVGRNLITPILSSDSFLELESDVDIDNRDVEETCGDSNEGTLKNTTQLPGNTNILGKNIRESEIAEEEDRAPLLKTNCCQREMRTKEAFLSQLNIDENNYLQNMKSKPSAEASALMDQSSVLL